MAIDTNAYETLVVMASCSDGSKKFTLSGLRNFLKENGQLEVVANNFTFSEDSGCEELDSALDLARSTGVITCPTESSSETYWFDKERVVSETPSALEGLGSDYDDSIDALGEAFKAKSFS
ncbi:hypothetical protein CMI41_04615 [Candidatus Pacearchaeota archaeon]|nr:hypothetical protein [Candidatus Pacearchaeota archaeon]|tara:strand:+ start:17813 stop:18175 length:363 start_codon:yes stop_codon:yes gene_type:complete